MADGGEGTLDAFAAAVPGAPACRSPCRAAGRPVTASWLLLPATDEAPEGTASSSSRARRASSCSVSLAAARRAPRVRRGDRRGPRRRRLAARARSSARAPRPTAVWGCCGRWVRGSRMPRATRSPPGAGARRRGEGRSVASPLPAGGAMVLSDVTNPLLGASRRGGGLRPAEGPGSGRVAASTRGSRAWPPSCPPTQNPERGGRRHGFRAARLGAPRARRAAVAELIGCAGPGVASVVVTGEGSFDGQSAAGKVPVARRCARAGRVCRRARGRPHRAGCRHLGFAASVSLTDLAGSPRAADGRARPVARDAGARFARALG